MFALFVIDLGLSVIGYYPGGRIAAATWPCTYLLNTK